MLHLPFVQTMLGSQISKTLETKLNTKVTIDKVNLGFLNRIIIDGLTIYDQRSEKMISASRMAAKIDYYQLMKNGRIYISSAQLFGFNGNFYKHAFKSVPNYQFVLDSLASKDNSNRKNMELSINSLVIRHGTLKYDRQDKPEKTGFNTNHIDIKEISAHFILPYYTSDSLSINVKKLSLKEKSGLNLRNLSFRLSADRNNAEIDEFDLRLPDTKIQLKHIKASYRYEEGKIDIPTLKYDGVVASSRLRLSDISCFIPTLRNNRQVIFITSHFTGKGDDVFIKRLGISSKDKELNIDASGTISGLNGIKSWNVNVIHSFYRISAIEEMIKGIRNPEVTLPSGISSLENIGFKGHIYGNKNDIHANGNINTGIGDAKIKLDKENHLINAYITTTGLELGKMLDDKRFGKISATTIIKGEVHKNGIARLNIDGTFPIFEYNSYQYRDITLNGTYNKNIFDGEFRLNDPNGQITMAGTVKTNSPIQVSDISVSVHNLDPSALKITDKWKGSKFDFDINTNGIILTNGTNLFNGNICISNMSMTASDEELYHLDKMNITAEKDRIYMQSDFGEAEIQGRYKLNTMANSITNVLHSKLPTLYRDYKKSGNRFRLIADIKKTDWLNALLNIPLELNSPLTVCADVDDENEEFSLQCNIDDFIYNENVYKETSISANILNDSLVLTGQAKKMFDNGNGLNLIVKASAINNQLKTGISWNNNQQKPMIGSLNAETQFIRNANGLSDFHINVKPSRILVNDTVWTVKPADITYNAGNLTINDFAIEHNGQYLKIDGMATKSQSDSITVDIQDINVKYILDLVNFHAVEFKGNATGKAYIKSVFYTPDMYANLKVKDFLFEDGRIGELHANVNWNKTDKQIDIDAYADDENGARTRIFGNVSPTHNSIDLNINACNTNIEFLESFCGSFMGDINARANGEVKLHGPLNSINLTGMLIADGNIRIKPLNTTYILENDTIRFLPDNIVFNNDTIRDRNGNIGIVNGALHHKNLTRLTYDLNITTRHLLCYDTHSYGENTFYGTAYGSGDCMIKGGNGRIDIDINITPEKGSFIEYNAANPESVSDQQFITWHDKTRYTDDEASNDSTAAIITMPSEERERIDIPSDMHINFLINMTPDATLRVLMDKTNEDYIALNGTGSISASYFNKGSFNMFGTYLIDHGTYKLTIQNIIKKVFRFQNGGTIVFGGDPYNAALNLKALYTINGVPLSDLQIGKSFSSNNIRVDCLMNISGTPQAPRVDFDIELPTVNNEAAQMVRTVINSEEEMNQQVVYLLGVGRFYIQKNNNSTEDETQQNQTSLAMQSLLSGTISQQINTLLGNIVKNNNWTFGANISTGDEGFNNAEYEGLLSGRLLNNRLVINGQFGYRDNANATTSFIGDFDINYLLHPNGNISLKVYNQTNDRYFTKSSLNTQGIAFIMKKDFNSLMELFGFKKKSKAY